MLNAWYLDYLLKHKHNAVLQQFTMKQWTRNANEETNQLGTNYNSDNGEAVICFHQRNQVFPVLTWDEIIIEKFGWNLF